MTLLRNVKKVTVKKMVGGLCGLLALGVSGYAFGFGLGVPGTAPDENFYYQVENTKLYRYICPPGVVPTRETCPEKDPGFLVKYETLREDVSTDLKNQLEENGKAVRAEVTRLKGEDPEVIRMKKEIRDGLLALQQLRASNEILQSQSKQLAANIATEEKQIDILGAKLTTDLPAEELVRTAEVYAARLQSKEAFELKLKGLGVQATSLATKIATLGSDVVKTSAKLGAYLPTILVHSNKLADLQDEKVLLENEIGLIGELDKRLTDSVAYPLHVWIATKAPGVKELVDTTLQRALRMNGGEVISRPKR